MGVPSASTRTVRYNSFDSTFNCMCLQMNLSGIPCRHIIRVAMQLNLKKLPDHLFLERWCKDPTDNVLIRNYSNFYSKSDKENQGAGPTVPALQHEEYDLFLLNQNIRRIERYAKSNSSTAKWLNKKLESLYEEARARTTSVSAKPAILNPVGVQTKGRPRLTSKQTKQPAKEKKSEVLNWVCRACGQVGHTSRSKSCPGKARKREGTAGKKSYQVIILILI